MLDNAIAVLIGTIASAMFTMIGNIVVALINNNRIAVEEHQKEKEKQQAGIVPQKTENYNQPPEKPKKPIKNPFGILAFIVISILISVAGLVYNLTTPKPIVIITNPLSNQNLECKLNSAESCSFTVRGTSLNVVTNKSLEVYVLLHPSNPSTPNWWFQTPPRAASLDKNGNWSVVVSYGSSKIMPSVGNTIEMIAVVLPAQSNDRTPYVSNPIWLWPRAQSDMATVSIGNLTTK